MSILDRLLPAPSLTAAAAKSAQSEALVSPWAVDNHLERMVIGDLYDTDASALPLDRAAAMRLPALAKGVRIITSTIARCPLVVTRDTEAIDSPLTKQLTPGVPNSSVIAALLDGLIFHGRAWLLITDTLSTGWPAHVQVVPEGHAQSTKGVLTHAFGQPVPPRKWRRIDALTEGILTSGASTLRDAMDLRHAAAETGASPVPTVILKAKDPSVTTEDLREVQQAWVAARRKRYGSAAAVSDGVDVDIVPQPTSDLLNSGQNAAAIDVARLLGLPAWALDAAVEQSSMSYSNSASRMRELVEFGLSPYITALEDGMSMLTPREQTVKVDTSELVNSDRKARLEDYKLGIEMGLYLPEEVRKWEGLPPLPAQPEPSNPQPAADTAADDTTTEEPTT